MKQVPFIITALLISLGVLSQSNIQVGLSGVFSSNSGKGLDVAGNFQIAQTFSLGLGVSPTKFERHKNLYLPFFATLKYYYPLSKYRLFATVDPGYGSYATEYTGFDGSYRNGAFYLAGGLGIMGVSRLAPYASVRFTKFGFTEHAGNSSLYRPISTFTFTAGITLNKLLPAKVLTSSSRIDSLPPLGYYSKKSERQKRTGWIILGSGAALFVGGLVAASRHEDGVDKAMMLVFISGPGLVTSLVSIPFFISSAQNKKKAMHVLSGIEMQSNPAAWQSAKLSHVYPALSFKVKL